MQINDLLPRNNEIKKIVQSIIFNECKKHQINPKDLSVFPITWVEYYKECFKNKHLKLYNITLPLIANGFFTNNSQNKQIVVFINQQMASDLTHILLVTFHEFRHLYQDTKVNAWSYEGLIFNIEQLLKTQNHKEYLDNHDKYFFEIDANLYGAKMAINYLENNGIYSPNSKELEYLKMLERVYDYDYFNFNFSSLFEKFINSYRNKKFDHSCLNFTMGVFLNKDGSFKSIKDIIKNPNFSFLDKRSIYSIISSKIFLKELDFSTLSKDDQELIDIALEYQQNLNSKRKLVNKHFFKEIMIYKSWSTQLEYLGIQMSKLKDNIKDNLDDNIINKNK